MKRQRRARYVERKLITPKCMDCGKKIYFTRKAAKSAIKNFYKDTTLGVYTCGEYYHVGHSQRKRKI